MDYNVCKECSTANEPEYIYCKNCGTPLKETKKSTGAYSQKQNPNFEHHDYSSYQAGEGKQDRENPNFSHQSYEPNGGGYSQSNFSHQQGRSGGNGFTVDSIDGIPMDEVALYVGKNSYKICPKLSKLELTDGKASWCWPTAVLGYFFGPLGAAIWFLYRKMYKAAAILIAIGVVFSVINTALTFDSVKETTGNILDSFEQKSEFSLLDELLEEENLSAREKAADAISEIVSILTAAVTGIFAFYWYKKHLTADIKRYRSSGLDSKYYRMGITALGGTSGGMVALGIVILFAVDMVISFVVMMISLM